MSTHVCAAKGVPDVTSVQVAPESVDVQTSPAATMRRVPVESDTTVVPSSSRAVEEIVVRCVHVAPVSEEVQTLAPELGTDHGLVIATRCAPVESDATDSHRRPEAAVPWVRLVQVAPESVEVQMFPSGLYPVKPVTATRCVPVESEATSSQGSPQAEVPAVR
jgi:hypothetical protein